MVMWQDSSDLQSEELPLIFRIGVALKPIVQQFTKVTVAVDALHPNNGGY